jgi:hypothetical protein
MAVDSEEFTELADEFALVAQTAAEAGIAGGEAEGLRVRRGWVNVPAATARTGRRQGHAADRLGWSATPELTS